MEGMFLLRKITNYLVDSGTFDSTTTKNYTVPASTRWILIGGHVYRDNNSTITVYVRDTSDNNIIELLNEGAAATTRNPLAIPDNHLAILDAGEDIQFTFGAAQGAASNLSISYLEVRA